jgi:radical SAM protein with 4Fe4S-binding SPASM domain
MDPYGKRELRMFLELLGHVRGFKKRVLSGKNAEDFPYMIQLQTQSHCNASCSICPHPMMRRKHPQGTMDEGLVRGILLEASQSPKLREVTFMLQNEPLLDRRLFGFIRTFKAHSPDKKARVITNGQLLRDFDIAEIASSGVDEIVISLNADSRGVFDRVNNGLDFEAVTENIERLVREPGLRDKVVVHFTLTKDNAKEVFQARKKWLRRGIFVKVRQLSNRAGTVEGYDLRRPECADLPWSFRLYSMAHGLVKNLVIGGCPLPFFAADILYNGDMILCCHDWDRNPVIGNVRGKSVKEVWNSQKFNEYRRTIIAGRYDGVAACKRCSYKG